MQMFDTFSLGDKLNLSKEIKILDPTKTKGNYPDQSDTGATLDSLKEGLIALSQNKGITGNTFKQLTEALGINKDNIKKMPQDKFRNTVNEELAKYLKRRDRGQNDD